MIAMPDPTTFNVLPWRPEDGAGVARMFADVQTPEGRPYEGDPRHVLRRAEERAKDMGFDVFNVGPELEYYLFRDNRAHRGPRRGRLLRPHDARRRLRRPPRHGARARAARHRRRVLPPRGRPVPARDRHALRERAEDGRRLHDLPHHGQGVRAQVRLARDVHAQAAVRPERLRHAHAPVAVQGRPQRVLRRRTTSTSCSDIGKAFIAGQLRHAREICSDLRPVGELLQAARAGLRGAGLRRLEPPQPLRARARPALPPRQGERDPDGAARAGPRVQPVPDVRGAAAGRPRGHRARLRAARADGEEPLPPLARTSAAGSASSSCRRRSARRSRSPPSPSSCCGRSASTSSTATSRSSARSGRTTASRSLRGSSSATWRSCSAGASAPPSSSAWELRRPPHPAADVDHGRRDDHRAHHERVQQDAEGDDEADLREHDERQHGERAERPGEHDPGAGDDGAGDGEAAQRALAGAVLAAPPRAPAPSGRCCSRSPARRGRRTPAAAASVRRR